jgi:hypothetical protein
MVEAVTKDVSSQQQYAQLQAAYDELRQEHRATKQRYEV